MNRIDSITERIILPLSDARPGRYPSGRVTDNRAEFRQRLRDHQCATSPRAERLRAIRATTLATHHDIIEDIAGVIALVIIIIILSTLS